jgi:hypothetical protein
MEKINVQHLIFLVSVFVAGMIVGGYAVAKGQYNAVKAMYAKAKREAQDGEQFSIAFVTKVRTHFGLID